MAKQSNVAGDAIDAYLAPLSADKRAALEALRATVRAAAPGAEEGFSYGLPAFRVEGRGLVAFGAAAKHCALYPLSEAVVADFAKELSGYSTSKGAIRFDPAAPLPSGLVRKIVKARIAELRAGAAPAKSAPKPISKAVGKPTTKASGQAQTSSRATQPIPSRATQPIPSRATQPIPSRATRPSKATSKTAAKPVARSTAKSTVKSTPKSPPKTAAPTNRTEDVLEYLRQLPAERRAALDELRKLVLSVDPRIGEELKWNSPSFFVADHFATFNLRRGPHADPNDKGVRLILHAGARAKGVVLQGAVSPSPAWLQWLAADRAMVDFADVAQIRARTAELRKLLRSWLEHLAK
jgi:uncharacterized protein YdhG (YjbR/CyaY superfamily)